MKLKPKSDELLAEIKIISPDTKIWGLTGGIASGKSTAAQYLREAGFFVSDTDQIAADLLENNDLIKTRLRQELGTDQKDKLREIVFSDDKSRKILESVLHPAIREESLKQIKQVIRAHTTNEKPIRAVFIEAALLLETGFFRKLDDTLVIVCDPTIQRERAIRRNPTHEKWIDRILSSQCDNAFRRESGAKILENNGNLEPLKHQLLKLIL